MNLSIFVGSPGLDVLTSVDDEDTVDKGKDSFGAHDSRTRRFWAVE